ncbi:hypothetical protein C0991_003430 [Blastosporella zonata]|nr:hypothetical protein C0991_003430 [Blastosporella zonata]
MQEFESILKDVVQAKRLSASKMSILTDIAMKSMEKDTQLVSTLYRTHKSLPPAAKVSSLYVFDALSRAAKHHVNKHGLSDDANSAKGNSATFLAKIEGVLEGLFQDMITVGSPEAKEKSKKILDIWVKGNTFPPNILTRLTSVVKGTGKALELPMSSSIIVDPRIAAAQPTSTTPPIVASSSVPPTLDPQATLLALLAQAAQAAVTPTQTTTNTSVPAGLDAAQLAVLQQLALAQTASNGAPSQPAPPQAIHALSHTAFPTPSYREETSYNSLKDPRINGPQSSDRVNAYDDQPEDRPSFRGGFRGGFRGRGRGRWDDRDRDRYNREHDRNRRSRSRSPPKHGARRDVKPYSPPRRPNFAPTETHGRDGAESGPSAGKDEFGRDIRPQSPENGNTPPPKPDIPQTPHELSPAHASTITPPASTSETPFPTTEPTVDPSAALTSNHDRMSLSPLIAANTSSSIPSAPIAANTVSAQHGLEKFNPMTFDFTSPASWEALGKMWQVTNGYLPSTEELGQFVMSGGQAPFASTPAPVQVPTWQSTPNHQGWRGRGRGRGGFNRGGFYGNVRDAQDEWGQEETQGTDAIVLGGGSDPGFEAITYTDSNSADQVHGGGTGGRMQRIGDKWVFVREPVST